MAPSSPSVADSVAAEPEGQTSFESDRSVGTRSAPLRVGERLGKYLLTARLGQGNEGMVFRALHVGLSLDRAVKVLKSRGANLVQLRERLQNEARLLSRIEHPNIVRVFDLEDDGDRPYFVMEFVEGLNLAELIAQSGRIAIGRTLSVITQVASGLRMAASFGVVHRDVKPANILLTKDGTAKLSDLGTGLLLTPGAGTGSDNQVVGTPYYMAPEQIEGSAPIDHRADIYALGSTFYHAVTGQLPFEGASVRELLFKKTLAAEKPDLWTPPEVLCADLVPEFSAVITKMMSPKAANRYQSYDQLLFDLKNLRVFVEPVPPPDPQGLSSTAATDARRTQQLERRLTATNAPRLQGLSEAVRIAMEALARGDKKAAREAVLPHRDTYASTEAVWLLLAKSAETIQEAIETAEKGLKFVPTSDRLKVLLAALLKQKPNPRKCLFCSQTEVPAATCTNCGGLTAFPPPAGYPTKEPTRPDQLRRAIGAYEKALRDRPDPRWENAIGLALLSLAQPAEALPHFQLAFKCGVAIPPDRLAELEKFVADARAAARRLRIAVVDDSPTIRKLVQAKLADFDYTVLPLADGDEAIARLPDFQPHLILMDINMPGKDGYQMCRWVKSHKALRDTPVVMLSGDDGFFDKMRGRMAGASRHIGKPFNTDELLQVIDRLCAKARRQAPV